MNDKYDKPRITSTVILGLFLISSIISAVMLLPISWADLNKSVEEAQEGGLVVALFLGIGIIAVAISMLFIAVIDGISLIFTIKNKNSTIPAVRIISYVMDGLFGLLILGFLIRAILLFCGI